jgi:hypothetical protein
MFITALDMEAGRPRIHRDKRLAIFDIVYKSAREDVH